MEAVSALLEFAHFQVVPTFLEERPSEETRKANCALLLNESLKNILFRYRLERTLNVRESELLEGHSTGRLGQGLLMNHRIVIKK